MPIGYQRQLNSLTKIDLGIVTHHEIEPLPSRFDESVELCISIVKNAIRVGRFGSAIAAINGLRDEVSEVPIHRLSIEDRDACHVQDSRVGLCIRTGNLLAGAGIVNCRQLSQMTAANVVAIPNLGVKAIEEIRRAILRVYPEARFRRQQKQA